MDENMADGEPRGPGRPDAVEEIRVAWWALLRLLAGAIARELAERGDPPGAESIPTDAQSPAPPPGTRGRTSLPTGDQGIG